MANLSTRWVQDGLREGVVGRSFEEGLDIRAALRAARRRVRLAVPLAPSAAVPRSLLPRVNMTVPDVTGIPSAVTVAVKVTGWPVRLGFAELDRVVTVVYGTTDSVRPGWSSRGCRDAVVHRGDRRAPQGQRRRRVGRRPRAVKGDGRQDVLPCMKLTVPAVTGLRPGADRRGERDRLSGIARVGGAAQLGRRLGLKGRERHRRAGIAHGERDVVPQEHRAVDRRSGNTPWTSGPVTIVNWSPAWYS